MFRRPKCVCEKNSCYGSFKGNYHICRLLHHVLFTNYYVISIIFYDYKYVLPFLYFFIFLVRFLPLLFYDLLEEIQIFLITFFFFFFFSDFHRILPVASSLWNGCRNEWISWKIASHVVRQGRKCCDECNNNIGWTSTWKGLILISNGENNNIRSI